MTTIKDMLCCPLTVDLTNDQLKAAMHKMWPRVDQAGHGFLLTVSGFAEDPRELWEIPECIDLFKRLVDIGFISLLEPCAQIAMPGTPAFGALEVWMVATGKITKKAKYPITQELVMELFEVLATTNVKLNEVLAAPPPDADIAEVEHVITTKGAAAASPLSDGQHQRKTYH